MTGHEHGPRPSVPTGADTSSDGDELVVLTEWESKALLPGLPRPTEALTRSPDEALRFARSVGAPVVAKASGPAHKSDQGLVRLGLDPDALAACWSELAGAGDGTVLVAEMVATGLELIVGGIRDPQWGPTVTVGLGGVLTEVLSDVVTLLSPVEPGEMERALSELAAAPLLGGYRGSPPVPLAELASIVHLVSDLMEANHRVAEIDLNPVAMVGDHLMALDALVVVTHDGHDPTNDHVATPGGRAKL